MTKMKSKKMTKSTFAIIIMAVAMVAMLAFGGTYAYFTATANGYTKDDILTATVKLTSDVSGVSATTATAVLPGQYVFGTATAAEEISMDNSSDVPTYVFVEFTAKTLVGTQEKTLTVNGADVLVTNVTVAENKWTELKDGVYYYTLAANADPEAFKFTIQLNDAIQANMDNGTTETTNVLVDGVATGIMGVTISLDIKIASIQQLGYETNIEGAYTDAFKAVAARS